MRVTSTGRLFSAADATTQVITVNMGAVQELDTWFKADSQSLGRLNQSASRLVVNGGTMRMTGVTGYGRGVTVNAGGATLETTAESDWLLNQLTDDVTWTYNGSPTLIFTGNGIGRFEKAINSGTGGVIKRGTGKWTLSRTSTYSGDTVVEDGILVLRRGSLNDTSTVSIASGAILSLRHYDGDVIGRLILGGVFGNESDPAGFLVRRSGEPIPVQRRVGSAGSNDERPAAILSPSVPLKWHSELDRLEASRRRTTNDADDQCPTRDPRGVNRCRDW